MVKQQQCLVKLWKRCFGSIGFVLLSQYFKKKDHSLFFFLQMAPNIKQSIFFML